MSSGLSHWDCEAIGAVMDDTSGEGVVFIGDEGFNISHAGGEHEVYSGLAQEVENVHGMYVLQIVITLHIFDHQTASV